MNTTVRRIFSRPHFVVISLGLLCVISVSGVAQTQREETQTSSTSGTISGRVVSDGGQPMANASVTLRGTQPLIPPRTVITDNDGNFQVGGLDPVLYGLFAFVPAYVTPLRDPESPPDYYRIGDSVTLNLVKGGVITGTVQSANGDPVVQIGVRAVMVRDANGRPPRFTALQMQRTTDDRGIYRIYGLQPGTYVVATGGRGIFTGAFDPYDSDAPTYAPSSPRDTATEVTVRAGEETAGVDIRYRGEPGRTISGFVSGLDPNSNIASSISLFHTSNGVRMNTGFASQPPNGRGFSFHGVADGEYEIVAQAPGGQGDIAVSEPRRITLKGTDLSGIELAVKTLGSITGKLALEKSPTPECKNKRQPLFAETLLVARRIEKQERADPSRMMSFFAAQGSPKKDGDFQLRNLSPGQYNLGVRFFARYWYLRSVTREMPLAAPVASARTGTTKRRIDLARDGLGIKLGERQIDVTFTLAEGAGSLRGVVKPATAAGPLPLNLYVHLVPAEKENADDVLRFFASEVQSDGTFALNNLPPGRYWVLSRVAGTTETQLPSVVRAPGELELRTKLRREAEAAKTEVEFKPCQNVTDYSLPFK